MYVIFLFLLTAERKTSLGKHWHRACLRCAECGKVLHPGQHAQVKIGYMLQKNAYNSNIISAEFGFRIANVPGKMRLLLYLSTNLNQVHVMSYETSRDMEIFNITKKEDKSLGIGVQ
jgi:hypothetical protein